MLAQQRQVAILREVERVGEARVSELVDLLGVSDMTVRRDITALAVNGLVLKVHGFATAVVGRSTEEPGFHVKSGMNPRQKSAIARVAARLAGQLIEVQLFDGLADDKPRKVTSS